MTASARATWKSQGGKAMPTLLHSQLPHLDLARGLAALAVAASHLRAFIFEDYGDVGSPGPFWQFFYLITSLGHEAVMIFFVLSGFLISRSVSVSVASGKWRWGTYATKRLVRLWIVLAPALILTAIWDFAGRSVESTGGFYAGAPGVFNSGPAAADAASSYSTWTFLANLGFLQTIIAPTFGSNGPLWSLANEFWYYVLFPLWFLAFKSETSQANRLIFGAFAVGLTFALPKGLVLLGLVWLMGYAVHLITFRAVVTKSVRLALHVVGASGFIATLAYSVRGNTGIIGDFMVGGAFSVWLVALVGTPSPGLTYQKMATRLADFSYTLYLTHFPLAALIAVVGLQSQRFRPGIIGASVYAGVFALLVGFGVLVWFCFERRTSDVQRAVLRILERRSTPS